MAKQTINIGTVPNDRTGDPLRTAFTKVNSNFTEVYNSIAAIEIPADLSELQDAQNLLFSGDYQDLTNTPTDLSEFQDTQNLLFSRDYQDLANTPFIPADLSDITDSTGTSNSKWAFSANGNITFPDNTVQTTAWDADSVDWAAILSATIQTDGLPVGTRFTQPIPTTSKGVSGDALGAVAFDSGYIYYCAASYTDGLVDIWKRVAWSNDTW